MTDQPAPAVNFAEIRQLAQALPCLAPVEAPHVPLHGQSAEALLWLTQASGKKPELRHMRLALFAATHGCFPESLPFTQERVESLTRASDPVVKVLSAVDADLRVYELDLTTPTRDYRHGPALDEAAAAHAMAYGMMAVEQGVQLLAVGGLGAGGELAHAELLRRLPTSQDPLQTLAETGGLECCAILGALIAARIAKVPVLADGLAAEAALAVLNALHHEGGAHVRLARNFAPDANPALVGLPAALAIGQLKTLAALS